MVAYSFKERFVDPIRVGLGLLKATPPDVLPAPKRQTIRAVGRRRHARAGEALQLYTGMRTSNCRRIGEARCTEVRKIILWVGQEPRLSVQFEDALLCDPADIEAFAHADGFANAHAMWTFWTENHPDVSKFDGILIKWEPLS